MLFGDSIPKFLKLIAVLEGSLRRRHHNGASKLLMLCEIDFRKIHDKKPNPDGKDIRILSNRVARLFTLPNLEAL